MTKRCDECSFYGNIDQYSGRCFRNEFRVSCAGSCPSHVAAANPAEIIEPDAVAKALEKINQHLDKLEQQHDEMLAMLKAKFATGSKLFDIADLGDTVVYVDDSEKHYVPANGIDLKTVRW